MQLAVPQAVALVDFENRTLLLLLLLQIVFGTYNQILLEYPLILDQTSPTKHVYPSVTAGAVF
jgi:hypothetical protein